MHLFSSPPILDPTLLFLFSFYRVYSYVIYTRIDAYYIKCSGGGKISSSMFGYIIINAIIIIMIARDLRLALQQVKVKCQNSSSQFTMYICMVHLYTWRLLEYPVFVVVVDKNLFSDGVNVSSIYLSLSRDTTERWQELIIDAKLVLIFQKSDFTHIPII